AGWHVGVKDVTVEEAAAVGAAVERAAVRREEACLLLVGARLGVPDGLAASVLLEPAGPGHAGEDLLHGTAPQVADGLAAAGALAVHADAALGARGVPVLAL
uniref:Uncharacterized protein n=1 Tax=Triticum urartu TaxID=4572 RepID=A0A8R7PPG0_TRIUA